MNAVADESDEMRILVHAPTGRDAENSLMVLSKAGLQCVVCRDLSEIAREAEAGAGAVILTEESLVFSKAGSLADSLRRQPSWSDLPIIILTRGGPESPAAIRAMRTLGNVMLLERPVRVFTLVTAAQTALRARLKQYQIRRQIEELRRTDGRKDEFLATLAHELRNPLAPVRTGLEVLRASGQLSGAAAKTRDMMDRQVKHMVRLIDDLMDVSRITRGTVELKLKSVDFHTIVDTALEASRPLLEAAGHSFEVSLPDGPLPVVADETRLAQVIENLLNNAAKYTPNGGRIELEIARAGNSVVIRVSDNGVGIAADVIATVFDMFTQIGRGIGRVSDGLGIGLTLVQRLVEMHGGIITAESAGRSRGSTFTVTLPIIEERRVSSRADEEQAVGPEERSDAFRILVVDDHVDGAETLALMLRMFGHQTRTAYDGPAAIASAPSFVPNVIFLDIGLPGMSGYEVARELRRDPALTDTVLVALTGWGSEHDKREATDAGFDYHLTKPADIGEVERILTRISAAQSVQLAPSLVANRRAVG